MDKQQIFAVMETDLDKSLAVFNTAAADLMNATYIIVSGKISKLLQSIAQSRPLYDFIAAETAGYNFVDDFRARQFRDENGRPYIAVPKGARDHLKFAFCMLFAIDSGKLNIENLLHTFYYNTDANSELRQFCAEIVAPFAENMNAAFIASPEPAISEPMLNIDLSDTKNFAPTSAEQLASPQPKLAPSPAPNPDLIPAVAEEHENLPAASEEPAGGENSEITSIVGEMIDVISHDITISILAREELMMVCDAFNTAASIGDNKPMRLMYIALKNTVTNSPLYDELSELLAKLGEAVEKVGVYA